ncbi:hypothetical protein AgCh_012008 [Apium graveolens]
MEGWFIRSENIAVQYGGLSRLDDLENGPSNPASEFMSKEERRKGDKAIIEEPVTFAEMYKRKMSKDLEVAKLKKLAKEKLLQEQDKLQMTPKSAHEIFA